MINAIIFDCDGVIVDSEDLRFESMRELFLKELNVKLPEKINPKRVGMMGNISYYLEKYGLNGDIEKLIEKREKILYNIFKKKKNVILIAGVIELVGLLKDNGYKIAIASGSSTYYIRLILDSLGLNKKFDCIITGDMIKRGKPNPEIFLFTAKRLDLNNKECVVIEDTLNGIKAAKKAGMKCIAITSTFPKDELEKSSADIIIDSLEKISLEIIKEL